MYELNMKSIFFRSLVVIALITTVICCEQNKETDSDIPDTHHEDTSSVPDPPDTLCPGGIFYDSDCFSDSVLTAWGMGSTELGYVSNDREYIWYIDQANTGPDSYNNCGPSSAAMAANWYDQYMSVTAEDARNMYPLDGGWWYTNNVIDFLGFNAVSVDVFPFTDTQQITDMIKDGNIIILCLTTALIRRNTNPDQRIDKFYSYADGHFLVVKGVRHVDATTYFEVYDPNNWHVVYNDNSEKGKNRHYRAEDIAEAVSNWWEYLIVVSPQGSYSKRADITYKKVDASKIKHARGR